MRVRLSPHSWKSVAFQDLVHLGGSSTMEVPTLVIIFWGVAKEIWVRQNIATPCHPSWIVK